MAPPAIVSPAVSGCHETGPWPAGRMPGLDRRAQAQLEVDMKPTEPGGLVSTWPGPWLSSHESLSFTGRGPRNFLVKSSRRARPPSRWVSGSVWACHWVRLPATNLKTVPRRRIRAGPGPWLRMTSPWHRFQTSSSRAHWLGAQWKLESWWGHRRHWLRAATIETSRVTKSFKLEIGPETDSSAKYPAHQLHK
jgi:hypothetical protein